LSSEKEAKRLLLLRRFQDPAHGLDLSVGTSYADRKDQGEAPWSCLITSLDLPVLRHRSVARLDMQLRAAANFAALVEAFTHTAPFIYRQS
jgi:hypothetical protein